jgi:hypothetical protein
LVFALGDRPIGVRTPRRLAIGAMMLAKADEIDAEFVSQGSFVDHVADNPRVSPGDSILADGNVAEPCRDD